MAFDLIAALREWKRKVAWLQERWRGARREIERLRKEVEQLRRREKQLEQLREENDKRSRFLGARGNRIPRPRGASLVPVMANGSANSLRRRWTKSSSCRRRHGVAAGAPWKWRGSSRSTNRKSCAGRSGGASIFPSVVARCAINGCQGAIRGRPPMPWERRRCNWGPTHWRWRSR